MFADALERAVNSNEQTASDVPGDSGADHPYYDHPELQDDREAAVVTDDACEGDAWKDHPYYDDPEEDQQAKATPDEFLEGEAWEDHPSYDEELEDAVDDPCKEVAREDHPYYDDLASSEYEQGDDDELYTLEEDQDQSHPPDEAAPVEEVEVACQEHPYYDTTDEEASHVESDVHDKDASMHDHSTYTTTEDEDEEAWEDSPYYQENVFEKGEKERKECLASLVYLYLYPQVCELHLERPS